MGNRMVELLVAFYDGACNQENSRHQACTEPLEDE